MLRSCLRLFKKLPESLSDKNDLRIDTKHGLVYYGLTKYSKELELAIKEVFPDYSGFSATFYRTWRELEEKTDAQILTDQLMHYFSTYGLEDFYGITGVCYLPSDADYAEGVQSLPFFRIAIIKDSELQEQLKAMLYADVAYGQQDIHDIYEVAEWLELPIDLEKVKNKELNIYIAYKRSIFPKNPTAVVRMLYYIVNGDTQLMNKPAWSYCLPSWDSDRLLTMNNILRARMFEIARVFYRYKKFLVSLKHVGSDETRSLINSIRRLAKTEWEPIGAGLDWETTQILHGCIHPQMLSSFNTFQLIKIYNRLASIRYQYTVYGNYYSLYVVRNGKMFLDTEPTTELSCSMEELSTGIALIKDIIADRLAQKGLLVVEDNKLDIALPTSTKSFLGDIPLWSTFEYGLAKTVGIHWNKNDIDLSFITPEHKIGWNGYYSQADEDGKCMFSGDMTRAICTNPECKNYAHTEGQRSGVCPYCKEPLHASEAVLFDGKSGFVNVSLYNSEEEYYDICFSEDDPKRGEILENITTAQRIHQTYKTVICGLVSDTLKRFIFTNMNPSQGNVAYCSEMTAPLMQVVESYGASSLKLKDITTELTPMHRELEEEDIWRTVKTLTKADLIEYLTD